MTPSPLSYSFPSSLFLLPLNFFFLFLVISFHFCLIGSYNLDMPPHHWCYQISSVVFVSIIIGGTCIIGSSLYPCYDFNAHFDFVFTVRAFSSSQSTNGGTNKGEASTKWADNMNIVSSNPEVRLRSITHVYDTSYKWFVWRGGALYLLSIKSENYSVIEQWWIHVNWLFAFRIL